MNFLAHLFLTQSDEAITVGNFLGDLMTNKQASQLPLDLQKGILIHRAIDEFTDAHPVVKESASLLKPAHGRYAPVVLDVMFDFLLAKNWERFSNQVSLRSFADSTYQVLLNAIPVMTDGIADRTKRMVAADWLVQYATVEGIAYTFSRMKTRSSQPERIESAAMTMMVYKETLEEHFMGFFPELINFVNDKMQGI